MLSIIVGNEAVKKRYFFWEPGLASKKNCIYLLILWVEALSLSLRNLWDEAIVCIRVGIFSQFNEEFLAKYPGKFTRWNRQEGGDNLEILH